MAREPLHASARDISKFSLVQFGVAAVFLAVVFWIFGGTDDPFPPIWLTIVLLLVVAGGAFFAERVWLNGIHLDPDEEPATNRQLAIDRFASQTVRKLVCTEIPLLVTILACFIFTEYGGWPIVIAGLPGLAVQAWETWPHLRNTSMAAAVFDADGAESNLVEQFRNR